MIGEPQSLIDDEDGVSVGWYNLSGSDDPAIERSTRELASSLSKFVRSNRNVPKSSLFERGSYLPPDNVYAEIATARMAASSDDILSSIAEQTEALAFDGVKAEAPDHEDTDIFNQINRDLDMDNYARQVWREMFATSQCVTAAWWGWKEYKVRGKTKKGTKRKLVKRVYCPQALTILDSTKVTPIGSPFDGVDRLAWAATKDEWSAWQNSGDPLMDRYMVGEYQPTPLQATAISGWGVAPFKLLELNESCVWRITTTKSDWEPFAPVRLRSAFRLLDLKQQLMDSDRVSLVGAANYILLVRKGTDQLPATQDEVDNLQQNFKVVAKLPVIIGDHRLSVEIITPKLDSTLDPKKYEVLNHNIALRGLGAFMLATGSRTDNTLQIGRLIAKGMENRRRMIARSIESNIYRAIFEHPFNEGVFDHEPNLVYVPKQIALDMDQVVGTAVQAMRNTGDLSRMSFLEHFGFDEAVEAQRRELEKDMGWDDVFQTHVPFDAPGNQPGGGDGAADPKGPGSGGDGGSGDNQTNQSRKAAGKRGST